MSKYLSRKRVGQRYQYKYETDPSASGVRPTTVTKPKEEGKKLVMGALQGVVRGKHTSKQAYKTIRSLAQLHGLSPVEVSQVQAEFMRTMGKSDAMKFTIEKAGPHKYKSRKKVGGKWRYQYDEPKGRDPRRGAKAERMIESADKHEQKGNQAAGQGDHKMAGYHWGEAADALVHALNNLPPDVKRAEIGKRQAKLSRRQKAMESMSAEPTEVSLDKLSPNDRAYLSKENSAKAMTRLTALGEKHRSKFTKMYQSPKRKVVNAAPGRETQLNLPLAGDLNMSVSVYGRDKSDEDAPGRYKGGYGFEATVQISEKRDGTWHPTWKELKGETLDSVISQAEKLVDAKLSKDHWRNQPPTGGKADRATMKKAGGHKYKSRKKVGGKWVYTYDDPGVKKLQERGKRLATAEVVVTKNANEAMRAMAQGGWAEVSNSMMEKLSRAAVKLGTNVRTRRNPKNNKWQVSVLNPGALASYTAGDSSPTATGKVLGAQGGQKIHSMNAELHEEAKKMGTVNRAGAGPEYEAAHTKLGDLAKKQVAAMGGSREYHDAAADTVREEANKHFARAKDIQDRPSRLQAYAVVEGLFALARAHEDREMALSKTKKSAREAAMKKAGPHKYKSRKKVGGKWVYDYGDGGEGKGKKQAAEGSVREKLEQDYFDALPESRKGTDKDGTRTVQFAIEGADGKTTYRVKPLSSLSDQLLQLGVPSAARDVERRSKAYDAAKKMVGEGMNDREIRMRLMMNSGYSKLGADKLIETARKNTERRKKSDGVATLSKARYYDMDYGAGKMKGKCSKKAGKMKGKYAGARWPEKESAFMGKKKSKDDIVQMLIAKMKEHGASNDVIQKLIAKYKGKKGKKVEHPVSEKQRRWAFAAEGRGELPEGTGKKWSRRAKAKKSETDDPIDLLKSLYDFRDSDDKQGRKLPNEQLPEYLAAFVEEAYEHEKSECEHRKNIPTGYDEQVLFFSKRILGELVCYMRHNADLKAAGKTATVMTIANILRTTGLLQPDVSNFNNAEGNGYQGESMAYSAQAPWLQDDPTVRPEAQLTEPHEQATFIDDTVDPLAELRKSQDAARRRAFTAPEPEFVVKGDGDCPLHGYRDLTKMQNLANPMGKCTCN